MTTYMNKIATVKLFIGNKSKQYPIDSIEVRQQLQPIGFEVK